MHSWDNSTIRSARFCGTKRLLGDVYYVTRCDLLRDALQFTTWRSLRDVVRVAGDDAVTAKCRNSDAAVTVRYMATVCVCVFERRRDAFYSVTSFPPVSILRVVSERKRTSAEIVQACVARSCIACREATHVRVRVP